MEAHEVIAAFGKAIGGGRRRVAREPLPVPAVVSRIERRQVATLVDFSSTGARLQGPHLPPVGEPVSLLIDCVRAFGTVAWTDNDLCGVAFDGPLARFEVDRLRRDAKDATLTFESVEEKLAVLDWMNGLAR